ncbi:MAG: leucine-rich repeat protein [Christensenellales bacterium]
MSKLKNIIGVLLIIGIIAGVGYFAYYSSTHKDNVIVFKGEEIANIKAEVGDEITLPTLSKEGYDFAGWYYDQNFSQKCDDIITMKEGTLVLYPKWDLKHFAITMIYLNNPEPSVSNVGYGVPITLPQNNVVEAGYKIVWIDDSTDEEILTNNIICKKEATYIQRKIAKTYTLNYYYGDANNSELKLSKSIVYNENTEKVYAIGSGTDVIGHTLNGWYYFDKNNRKVVICENDYLTESMVNSADADDKISIYGNYSINSYLLVFKDESNAEIKSVNVEYGASVQAVLDTLSQNGEFEVAHKTLIGWQYVGGDGVDDFTDVVMPANSIEIQPLYELDKYNISMAVKLRDNIVPITTIIREYEQSLYDEDLPTTEQIESAIANFSDWQGNYSFDEFSFDNYTVNDETSGLSKSNLLIRFASIEEDNLIILNYVKDRFFVDYYKDAELTELYTRIEITTKDEFALAPNLVNNDENYVFGGWLFADNPNQFFEYDCFDLINIGEDVTVYADFYRNDLNRWESKTIDGNNYITKYNGAYEAVVVPAQTLGTVYGIGDGVNAILKSGVLSKVKRILIPETINVINTNAFANTNVLIRFVNKASQDLERYGLQIKEGAFTSVVLQSDSSSASISSIKLPSRTTVIEEGAFAGAIDLAHIDISGNCANYECVDGVLYKKASADSGKVLLAYPMAKDASAFVLPSDVERIAKGAFKVNIDSNSFSVLNSITKVSPLKTITVNSGNSLKEIGERAFYGNYQLTGVSMASLPNLTSVGVYAFYSCFNASDSLTNAGKREMVFDFNNLDTIPENFLAYSRILSHINLLNVANVKYLSNDAFVRCGEYLLYSAQRDLSFTFAGNYNSIGNRAFYRSTIQINFDTSFNMVDEGDNVATIGDHAFNLGGSTMGNIQLNGVNGLTKLSLSGVNIGYYAFAKGVFNLDLLFTDCDFNYPLTSSSGENFASSKIKGDLEVVYTVANGTLNTAIRNRMFDSLEVQGNVIIDYRQNDGQIANSSLKHLTCNNLTFKGVSSFGTTAFGSYSSDETVISNSYGPKNIVFDDTCTFTSLGKQNFFDCKNLESVTLSSSITSIDANTFASSYKDNDTQLVVAPTLPKLTSVIIGNATNVVSVYGGDLSNIGSSVVFYVPTDMLTAYSVSAIWTDLYTAGQVLENAI